MDIVRMLSIPILIPILLIVTDTYQYSYRPGPDIKIWRMPEHDAASQLNLAPSRQEVKHRNNNITSGYISK